PLSSPPRPPRPLHSFPTRRSSDLAASLTTLPLLPRLVFLVVGPAVDVKLIALQAGTFGRAFAARFAPLTFAVAVGCAVVAGLVLDRKSTRLNSSHVKISYAVFCLK